MNESTQRWENYGKGIGIDFVERHLWVWGLAPGKKFLKQLSLECQKILFCVVGNHVCNIDFHPGIENMILHSNLYCANLKRLKTLIFKEEIL